MSRKAFTSKHIKAFSGGSFTRPLYLLYIIHDTKCLIKAFRCQSTTFYSYILLSITLHVCLVSGKIENDKESFEDISFIVDRYHRTNRSSVMVRCFVQQAHITNGGNKQHTLYLHEVADDRDVGEQIVATAAATRGAAPAGQAGDGQASSGASW